MLLPTFRFPWIRVLLTVLLLSATGFGAGKGVIIYKDQTWLADEFAQAVEYDELEQYPNIFHVTTAQNEKVPILTWKIVKSIRYLDRESLAEIVEPRDLTRVSSAIEELSATARQYPKSAKILEPRIRQLQEIVNRFRKGEVIMFGAWQPSKEAAIKLKKEREAAIAAADAEDQRQADALQAAREKRAADERVKRLQQKELFEKESHRRQEEAKAAEEQRRLSEASQAAEARQKEEQQRIAEEKQASDERHIEYASRKMREADRFTEEFDRPAFLESATTVFVAKLQKEGAAPGAEQHAINAAQSIVRHQLKEPLTAKFREARVLQKADPWYQLFMAVDSENALGMVTRTTYVCTLKLGAGDEFTYDQSRGVVAMDEEAIKREGALGEIRAACGWRANQER